LAELGRSKNGERLLLASHETLRRKTGAKLAAIPRPQ
jgi:hypothetical protein